LELGRESVVVLAVKGTGGGEVDLVVGREERSLEDKLERIGTEGKALVELV
jgi:hypothetical protein